jgi:N-acetylmuramic acid 6-phosphate etherase
VDLQASNAKLRDRAERIVCEVCGVTAEDARDLLRAADGSVKLAIVMGKLNVNASNARAALEKEGGVIRRVVKGPPPPVERA